MNTVDLVTLVTACSLTVDPKIMHALIWHQSGGEPWSFTVPGERQPQVYRTARDAVRAARATDRDDIAIRVGLTGLSTEPRTTAATMFALCPNIAIAARQITELGERCRTSPRLKGDPVYCAIAAYRGSWEQPDNVFADAVRTSVAKDDAPDFEMPAGTSLNFGDIGSTTLPALHDAATAPTMTPDDRQRAWSSALFPVKSRQFDSPSSDSSTTAQRAADAQRSDASSAAPQPTTVHADGLFVPRSAQRNSP